jgi:hypothetical protein
LNRRYKNRPPRYKRDTDDCECDSKSQLFLHPCRGTQVTRETLRQGRRGGRKKWESESGNKPDQTGGEPSSGVFMCGVDSHRSLKSTDIY